MTEGIIIAIITGLFSVLAVAFTNHHQNSKITTQLDKHQAVTDEKISELRRETEKHNKVIERTYKLEKDVEVIKTKLKMWDTSDKE